MKLRSLLKQKTSPCGRKKHSEHKLPLLCLLLQPRGHISTNTPKWHSNSLGNLRQHNTHFLTDIHWFFFSSYFGSVLQTHTLKDWKALFK